MAKKRKIRIMSVYRQAGYDNPSDSVIARMLHPVKDTSKKVSEIWEERFGKNKGNGNTKQPNLLTNADGTNITGALVTLNDYLKDKFQTNINPVYNELLTTGDWGSDEKFAVRAGQSLKSLPDDDPGIKLSDQSAFDIYGLPPGFGVEKNYGNPDVGTSGLERNDGNSTDAALLYGYIQNDVKNGSDTVIQTAKSGNHYIYKGANEDEEAEKRLAYNIADAFRRLPKGSREKSGYFEMDDGKLVLDDKGKPILDEDKIPEMIDKLGTLLLFSKTANKYVHWGKGILRKALNSYDSKTGKYRNKALLKASKSYLDSIRKNRK